jgi:hypothetical protein
MKTKEELESIINDPKTPEGVKELTRQKLTKLTLQEKSAEGDQLATMLSQLAKALEVMERPMPTSGISGINKEEVRKLISEAMKSGKIDFDDLSDELQNKIAGQVKVTLNLTTNTFKGSISTGLTQSQIDDPLFQKMVSDVIAKNNTFLFGQAGTGKTYISESVARFLGWKYIEVNCNQFTSPLDLVGGQTIDGYQKGKLEMAWTNVDENGDTFNGAVLCLDELPKLDPNTAGLLNSALAKTKLPKAVILNGRGQAIEIQNVYVIATGNTKLNETSLDYEANFKQDLSLQDRFVGSCYEVFYNYKLEFNEIMNDFLFIWIYMMKVRRVIIDERGYSSQAFVSMRILISMRDTYRIYREWLASPEQTVDGYKLSSPKTLKDTLDSFLSLFKPNQIVVLKEKTNYNKFIDTIEVKNKIVQWQDGKLNTSDEVKESLKLVKEYEDFMKSKQS